MKPKLVVVLTGALMLACTSPSTHPGAAAELATSVCDLAYRCCNSSETAYLLGPFVTPEDCPVRLVRDGELSPGAVFGVVAEAHPGITVPNLAALDRAIESGRISVDDGALSECLTSLEEVGCNTPPEDPGGPLPELCPRPPMEEEEDDPRLHPCRNIFLGNVAEGSECTSGLDGLECMEGLACWTFGGLGVQGECVRLGEVGELCSDDDQCADELYCSLLDGTCQPFRLEGETCAFADRDSLNPDPETELLRCDEALFCDPITDTCVAPCERGSRCFDDEQCDDTQGLACVAGRCDTPRALGLPCDDDDDCVADLRCGVPADSPTGLPECIERLPNRSECFDHSTCMSGFCDPTSNTCQAAASVGDSCPSGSDAQCAGDEVVCRGDFAFCSTTTPCPDSRECDTAVGRCLPACVRLLGDGQPCMLDGECASGTCIGDICGTPPFASGQPCSSGFQCESTFCGLDDPRVCTELPLPIGERCSSSDQCESGVCFGMAEPRCVTGAGEGEPCTGGVTPCDPRNLYCDTTADPPSCAPLRETGEPCESSRQCRGDCTVRLGRFMCSPAAPPDAAVCDGGEA